MSWSVDLAQRRRPENSEHLLFTKIQQCDLTSHFLCFVLRVRRTPIITVAVCGAPLDFVILHFLAALQHFQHNVTGHPRGQKEDEYPQLHIHADLQNGEFVARLLFCKDRYRGGQKSGP